MFKYDKLKETHTKTHYNQTSTMPNTDSILKVIVN